VANDPVRFKNDVVARAIHFTFQHLDIAPANAPHQTQQIGKKTMAQRLLPQAGIVGVGPPSGIDQLNFGCI
jgi:hypothetical protein